MFRNQGNEKCDIMIREVESTGSITINPNRAVVLDNDSQFLIRRKDLENGEETIDTRQQTWICQ